MKKMYNVQLAQYTTIKIGGVATEMLIPESVDELRKIIRERKPSHFLGGVKSINC